MDDARLCAARSPATIVAGDPQHAGTGSLPSREDGREIVALDVRHRDVLDAVDLAEIVNADDVLVRDLPGEQQLALEAALDFAAAPGSAAISGRTTLSATATPSSASHAWYTAPIPPRPSSRMM